MRAELTRAAPGSTPQDEAFSFRDALFYWTALLEELYNREFIRAAKPKRTTVSRWRVLAVLNEVSPATVGDLAHHTQIEPAVMSRLVDQMEREGLLSKSPRPSDRRVTEVRITPRGEEEFAWMLPMRREVFRRAIKDVTDEEYATMLRLVQRMIGNLDQTRKRSHP